MQASSMKVRRMPSYWESP